MSFLSQLDLKSIVAIASSVRRKMKTSGTSCIISGDVSVGAHHAAWTIEFEDGIHWIFRIPLIDNSPILEKRIKSDLCGIRLIRSKTNVPIPHIVALSTTPENPLGRPYVIMEKPGGVPLSDLWCDAEGISEEKRKILFRSLASVMSQLKAIEFDQIGSLYLDEVSGIYTVGPTIPSYEEIVEGHLTTRGTYPTTHTYLLGEIRRQFMSLSGDTGEERKSFLALLRVFAGFLPDHHFDEQPFVLSSPKLDLHSIFVDENWNVKAITEWDSLFVGPREGGYAKYPSWITLDWDPLIDRYPTTKVIDYNPWPNSVMDPLSFKDRDWNFTDEELFGDDGETSLDNDGEPLASNGDSTEQLIDSSNMAVEFQKDPTSHLGSPASNTSRPSSRVAVHGDGDIDVEAAPSTQVAEDKFTDTQNAQIAEYNSPEVPESPISEADGSAISNHRNVNDPEFSASTEPALDSPILAILDAYRREYLEAFTDVDPNSARYTRSSHIFNALERTALSSKSGSHILYKFKEFMFGPFTGESSGYLLEVPILLKRLSMGKWIKDLME